MLCQKPVERMGNMLGFITNGDDDGEVYHIDHYNEVGKKGKLAFGQFIPHG
jgi:hypothetical protein